MKTYFKYKGNTPRIARDCGSTEDRYTEAEVIAAIESGDAVFNNEFLLHQNKNKQIMAVIESDPHERKNRNI